MNTKGSQAQIKRYLYQATKVVCLLVSALTLWGFAASEALRDLGYRQTATGPSSPTSDCQKTYTINPGGARITANVRSREMNDSEGKLISDREAYKYGGNVEYRPSGEPATRRQDCAGYVMAKLFPAVVKPGWFMADNFYQNVAKTFGEITLTPAKGDVAVYLVGDRANHVAMVDGPAELPAIPAILGSLSKAKDVGSLIGGALEVVTPPTTNIPILTKDAEERPYRGVVPVQVSPGVLEFPKTVEESDPLISQHANPKSGGRVVFYRIDPNRVSISEAFPGDCDGTPQGAGGSRKGNNSGQRPCTADEAAAFAKMTGSWKSYRMNITISGSCEQATGTFRTTEWCEGVDTTYNSTVARVDSTFTGRMTGGSLQLTWDTPPHTKYPASHGTGSCSLKGDGTFSCSPASTFCENKFKTQ